MISTASESDNDPSLILQTIRGGEREGERVGEKERKKESEVEREREELT